ncbi:MAG: Bcr/CflA family efflux MFS transporter [Alphaproteobacteria bacterium]|nr:Bcr/CflA family efflux MFS transporter [Alphaproteobacteria bacterium]
MSAARSPAPLALLIAVSALGPATINIFIPSMPGVGRAFDVDYEAVQLSLTLYLIGIALGQLVYGPISDRHGRRPALIGGFAIYALGTVVCFFADGIWGLIVGRVIQSIGGCAGLVMARAIVRDLYDRNRAASELAYVTTGMVALPMIAPTIGGYLDAWFGWRASFIVLEVAALIILTFIVGRLKETHRERTGGAGAGAMLTGFVLLLRRPAFLGYALHAGSCFGVFYTFMAGAPYLMVETLGKSPEAFGPWFITIGGSYMLGNFVAGRISVRRGVDSMIALGSAIQLAGLLVALATVLAGWLSPVSLFLPIMLVSIGQGLAIPNAMAGTVSVDPARAGAAAGLSGFMQMAAGAGATFVAGILVQHGALPYTIMMLVFCLAGIAAFGLGVTRRPVDAPGAAP